MIIRRLIRSLVASVLVAVLVWQASQVTNVKVPGSHGPGAVAMAHVLWPGAPPTRLSPGVVLRKDDYEDDSIDEPEQPEGDNPQGTDSEEESDRGALRRKDVPPGLVSAALQFAIPAYYPVIDCDLAQDNGNGDDPDSCPVEILRSAQIGLRSFLGASEVRVTITRPDGDQDTLVARPGPANGGDRDGVPMLTWFSHAGDARGKYRLVARQGGRSERYQVIVGPAMRQSIDTFPVVTSPGGTVNVELAGYQPRQRLPLHVYQLTAGQFSYVTTLGTIVLDRRGEGIFHVRTSRDDPEGKFMVIAGERVGPLVITNQVASFELRRDDPMRR